MLHSWLERARNAFHASRGTGRQSMNLPAYSALIDAGTNALLDLRQNAPAVNFLAKCFPDTFYYGNVNYPNYKKSFFLLDIPAEQFSEWAFNNKSRTFHKRGPDAKNDSLRNLSRLAVARGNVATHIINNISHSRFRKGTGIAQQEYVYILKRIEAEKFRDSNYDEEKLLEYPLVLQYAEFADITPRVAADEILFKARLHDEDLVKTELMRMKYFKLIKEIKTPEEAPLVQKEFMKEFYKGIA
jgi:hypothetical protein